MAPLDIAKAATAINKACVQCLSMVETCAEMLKDENLTPPQIALIQRRLEEAGEIFRKAIWESQK